MDQHAVKRIKINGAGLTEFPASVFEAADTLEELDLSGNAISEIPANIGSLAKLRILFLSSNKIAHLPACLGSCASLEMLALRSNGLVDIHEDALPPRLRWLILTQNALSALPSRIGECARLEKLMLAGNALASLPDSLCRCSNLALVRLSANALPALPAWLPLMPRLAWIAFAANPFEAPLPPSRLAAFAFDGLDVEARLGEGASSEVWRVRERASDQRMALKLFRGALTSDGLPASELAACLHAGSLGAAAFPRVLGTLAGHPDGRAGVLLGLVDPTRFAALAGPPSFASCTRDVYDPAWRAPSEATALVMLRALAAGVAQLHAGGLLHGDLYAHNVLCCRDTGEALLSDFGAASHLAGLDAATVSALQRCEVLALGYLLIELAERTDNMRATTAAQLGALASACVQPDVERRPSAADVLQALLACGAE